MAQTYYMALIQTEPRKRYQPYKGWDTVFTVKGEAEAQVASAQRKFHGAKLATATPDEAVAWGWLPEAAKHITLTANWAQASSPIRWRYRGEDEYPWEVCPFQVADARHDEAEAYRMVWDWLEREAG